MDYGDQPCKVHTKWWRSPPQPILQRFQPWGRPCSPRPWPWCCRWIPERILGEEVSSLHLPYHGGLGGWGTQWTFCYCCYHLLPTTHYPLPTGIWTTSCYPAAKHLPPSLNISRNAHRINSMSVVLVSRGKSPGFTSLVTFTSLSLHFHFTFTSFSLHFHFTSVPLKKCSFNITRPRPKLNLWAKLFAPVEAETRWWVLQLQNLRRRRDPLVSHLQLLRLAAKSPRMKSRDQVLETYHRVRMRGKKTLLL